MARGFKITLVANRFVSLGLDLEKPFSTIMAADSPKLKIFKDNPAFKVESVEMHDVPVPAAEPEVPGLKLESIEALDSKVVALLKEAGFITAEQILSEDVKFDDLTSIKGIGESTANKAIEICEQALESLELSEDDPDSDDDSDEE
jgi:hypothetical protein